MDEWTVRVVRYHAMSKDELDLNTPKLIDINISKVQFLRERLNALHWMGVRGGGKEDK